MSKSESKPILRSPLGVFNQITRIIELTTYPVGLEILDDNYRINFRTLIMFFVIGFYYLNAGYTVWYFSSDILAALEVICMTELAIPVRPTYCISSKIAYKI